MLIAVGTRVRFLHSRDQGVVTELLDNGMVNVLLDEGGFEIPAFVDDLARSEKPPGQKPSVKAKIIKGKDDKKPVAPERPPIQSQYTILKSMGIQLAFDPQLRADGHADKYQIYLINDTYQEALFSFELQLNGLTAIRLNGKLAATAALPVGELLFDQLNDAPLVKMECWRITTQGTGSRMAKTLRIKPKQFFKRVVTAPLLNRRVHLYRLFENLNGDSEERDEDLKSYTRRYSAPGKRLLDAGGRMPHEVLEFAEFIPELDLHIEKLASNHKKLSKAEILRVQLSHFDSYLYKAIRLGVERVFIIHGIGKGRLRDAIASRLLRTPEVQSFRNEYHPRYGYGATEVIF